MRNPTLNLFEPNDEFGHQHSYGEMIDLTVDGMDELGFYSGKRPTQCFTMKMPFPLYLKLKKLSQTCQRLAPEEKKDFYTMTACITALTRQIGIPALERVAEDLRTKQSTDSAA